MKANDLSLVEHIRKQLKIAKKTAIKVGLPADVGFYPKSGLSVVEVGTRHEYGLGVPRRSFLRMPFELKEKELKDTLEKGYKSILKGGDTITNLNKVGLVAQNISKGAFKTGGYGHWKDIKPETKEAKGSSKILVDTARLLQSITYWVVKE